MQDMRKRLPHLDPLIAFEAAARHSGFARAAKEMNITPSAVSQQIRALETQLSTELFERGHKSVQLNAQGREFYNSVALALKHLASAADDVRVQKGVRQLSIAADTSIATHWLLPRLPRFEAQFPGIVLRIHVSDIETEILDDQVQISLIHGQGGWRGHDSDLLFAEEVFPVCSPDYLASKGGSLSATDLAGADLLDLDYKGWDWMNWSIWLTEMSLPVPQSPRRLRMNNYPLLIEAARRGHGVALGWRHLCDQDIVDGLLVRPLSGSVKTSYGYYVCWPFNSPRSPEVEAFKSWLDQETAKSI